MSSTLAVCLEAPTYSSPLFRTQLVKETGLGKSWQMMEELQKEGKTKSIGVSNYRVGDLEEVLKVAKVCLHM
jgi:diketogulonate reductase-like aldo/keto reductase